MDRSVHETRCIAENRKGESSGARMRFATAPPVQLWEPVNLHMTLTARRVALGDSNDGSGSGSGSGRKRDGHDGSRP